MKLRTKLLLGVGLLLFAMAVIMYILPTIFVRKDVHNAADAIHSLLVSEHQQLMRSQQLWLEDSLETIKENNDALLFMMYEEPYFSAGLTFGEKTPDKSIWHNLARIAGYDPSIGFVQVHSPEENKIARISPHATTLYSIEKMTNQEGTLWISLQGGKSQQKTRTFVGVPLPAKMQTAQSYTLYALIEPGKIKEQLSEVHEEIEKLIPEIVEKPLTETNRGPIAGELRNQPPFQWAAKVDMIRTLTPFYVEWLSIAKEGSTVVPEGLARVDATGGGYAILSDEVFSTQLIFDDALYYKLHPPKAPPPPLASGAVFVTDSKANTAYIGNTLLLGKTYFSIGTPLYFLARQLALSSNRMILLMVNKNFWIGFDGEGNQLAQETINQIAHTGVFKQESGVVNIAQNTFTFARVTSLEGGNLIFFDLRPYGGEKSIDTTLTTLENKLSTSISRQFSLISLGTMLLVLFFIGRIGFTVINPVTKLASATQDVVAGRYEEVVLPEMGNRKDEVAILTHSFEDMVRGLQEREKIRGVLDKVVSKEVADEILKTHIHLGGEDRVVTMLFSDIRDFTALTADLSPQKTIQLLNACMTKISRVIEGEGGVIDKYVGDEVMAIFGAPTSHPDQALRAVSTGMLMVETLKKWNLARVAAQEPPILMGIGVHTGLVVAGNMGAEDRLNYTVLGANVNLAARLCEVAEPNQLIISEATLLEPNVKDSFYTKPLSPITLKGFTKPVQIYEIIGFKWDISS
jgi:class 3 adenylate cyclase